MQTMDVTFAKSIAAHCLTFPWVFPRLNSPQASLGSGCHQWLQAFRHQLQPSGFLAPAQQQTSSRDSSSHHLPLFPVVAGHHEIELVLPGHCCRPQPGQKGDDVDPLDQNSEHNLLWDISQYCHPTGCRDVPLPANKCLIVQNGTEQKHVTI